MDAAAAKLVESATLKTLHAHNFSRTSSQAQHVLADLLQRYLALLASSSAKHANHAGRRTLSTHDIIAALDDLGVGIDELSQFCAVEAKELNRYASHSARRVEDLHEFSVQSSTGLRQDHDDATLLDFLPYDIKEEEDEDEMDVDVEALVDVESKSSPLPRPTTPPLPLSPISNPSSPSRKRARTASWKPPPHVPAFLPPFPSTLPDPPSPIDPETELMPPPQDPHKVVVPVPTQAMTASTSSDYLVQIPYSQSSLSSVPEWHLPAPPPSNHLKTSPQHRNKTPLPTLQTEPALFKAYHHILTNRGPTTPPPSTLSRHKVSMAFIAQTQATPRWDATDSLYSTVAPCPPRVAVIAPSYPVSTSKEPLTKVDKDFRFPPTIPKPVSTTERLTPLLGQQSNRIPELARHVLPPIVMNRITRLAHPPVLHRGNKPLFYGRGIPAPWNSNVLPPTTDGGIPPTPLSGSLKDKDNANGNGETSAKASIPDAHLFATWDYETKDYKVPLHSAVVGGVGSHNRQHHPRRIGSLQTSVGASGAGAGTTGAVISLNAATTRSRSGSKLG